MASAFWTGGPHNTDGLSGYPARDFGAPGGTILYAWEPLRVERISGSSGARGKGFGGFNVYLSDIYGKQFFVTHLENLRVRRGQVLRPGQVLAAVGDYRDENGMATHVHVGYTGGDPVSVLGLRPEYLFTPGGAAAGSKYIIERKGVGSSYGVGDLLGDVNRFRPTKGIATAGDELLERIPVIGGPASSAFSLATDPLGIVGGPLGAAKDAYNVVKSPVDAIRWVTGNWDRALEVMAGFVLLLIGLILLGARLGMLPGGAGAAVASRVPGGSGPDPVESAYASGEEAGLRAAARSAGRREGRRRYESSRPSSQGTEIPY